MCGIARVNHKLTEESRRCASAGKTHFMNTSTYRRATALLLGFGLLSFAWWIGAGTAPAFARNPIVRKDDATRTIKVADVVRDPSDLMPPVGNRPPAVVQVTLKNANDSTMVHSVDLHAVIGPGSGAVLLQVPPGQSKTITFEPATPGLFVYHCGSPMIAQHVVNGMYGLSLSSRLAGCPMSNTNTTRC